MTAGVLDIAQARAAELFRENHAHQAHFGHLGNQLGGKMGSFVPFHDVRSDFRFGEFANAAAELLLLVAEGKVHKPPENKRCP